MSNLLKYNEKLRLEYNFEKNKEIELEKLTCGSKIKVWWKCKKGHEWEASIVNRNRGSGCIKCHIIERKKMDTNAKEYFNLANQYFDSSKLLIETIIENKNQNIGIGFSENEAMLNMVYNIKKSDARLLIPALFLGYQSMELYIKGLLLLKKEKIKYDHDVKVFYIQLKKCYGENSNICRDIDDFYENQIKILNNYKEKNRINSIKDLYESFRYPEIRNGNIDHLNLKYNGEKVVTQLKTLLHQMTKIEQEVLKEYSNNENCSK